MKRKVSFKEADDETSLSQIRGIGNVALQKLAASGLVKDFSPKITLGEFKKSGVTYKQLKSKEIRGIAWRGILGDEPMSKGPPLDRQTAPAGQPDVSTDNAQELRNPSVNPMLAPQGLDNPVGDPQLATNPGETPEVLAQLDQSNISGARAVPTGMLAGGQATPSVIPDVQLNLSPGDATIVPVAKPALEPLYPIAPADALGLQQGFVGARQVEAQTHEQTVYNEAMGKQPPTNKADGSGDIGEDGKGSLALENEEQKRIDMARGSTAGRGFRSVPMSMPGSKGAKDMQPPQAKQGPQPMGQDTAEPYRQQSLFRNFDSRISGSKTIRKRRTSLMTRDKAAAAAASNRMQPSMDQFNAYTQGVNSWAEPLISTNNFLDRSSMITSLQYNGAQGLMNIYDPAPVVQEAAGFGFRRGAIRL